MYDPQGDKEIIAAQADIRKKLDDVWIFCKILKAAQDPESTATYCKPTTRSTA